MANSQELSRLVARRLDDSLNDLPTEIEQALAASRQRALRQQRRPYVSLSIAASVLVAAIAWPLLHSQPEVDTDTSLALLMEEEPQLLEDLDMLETLAEVGDDS